jgi:SAM-dependent methyltransferase
MRRTLTRKQDAHGAAMLAALDDPTVCCVLERDDGSVHVDHAVNYLREYRKWGKHERDAIRLAKGRVLDVGCGAGRVALHLQGKGLRAVGIDNSPAAIKACRRRGLKQVRAIGIEFVSRQTLGMFDTVVMYGNNFGLFGSFDRARRILRRFHRMTSPGARIIAQTMDPHLRPGQKARTPLEKCHLAYRRANVRRGRMPGQVRFRLRYRDLSTPYLDYLLVSRDEMRRIVDGTGWRIARFFDSPGANYVAVLEKSKEGEQS